MYKKASKATTKRKLYENRAREKRKVSRPKKRGKVGHYKGKSIMASCCICKATTPHPMISIQILQHAVCEFCMNKHFKNREEAQRVLKEAIDVSGSKKIDMRDAIHEMQKVKVAAAVAHQSAT